MRPEERNFAGETFYTCLETGDFTVWKVSDFFQHRLFHPLVTAYKVSIAGKNIIEQLSKFELRAEDALWPTDVLSAAFADLVEGNVQVVVQSPLVGEYSRHQ